MSLDGFIAGPDDSMDWVVAAWSEGGENTRDIDGQRSTLAEKVLEGRSDSRRSPLVRRRGEQVRGLRRHLRRPVEGAGVRADAPTCPRRSPPSDQLPSGELSD